MSYLETRAKMAGRPKWWQAFIPFYGKRYRFEQRKLDIKHLWPSLKQQAGNTRRAREAFALHCAQDPIWTKDLSNAAIEDIAKRLR